METRCAHPHGSEAVLFSVSVVQSAVSSKTQ